VGRHLLDPSSGSRGYARDPTAAGANLNAGIWSAGSARRPVRHGSATRPIAPAAISPPIGPTPGRCSPSTAG
jgi:hypothetical protein